MGVLRDFFEDGPDLHVSVEIDTRVIVDCNRALCAALGYEKSELVGKRLIVIDVEDDESDASLVDVDRRLRRKDGSALDASLSLRGALASYRDITQRKQAERDRAFLLRLTSLRERSTSIEQIFRTVSGELGVYLGAARVFFFSVNADGLRGTVHPGYTSDGRLLPARIELAAFTGETEQTIAVANHREGRWTASLVVTHRQGRAWEPRELALVRQVADRVWQWLEQLRLVAQVRERDVAAAVERNEDRYRVLLESVKDYALIMLDANGRIAVWNTCPEAIGRPYDMFFAEEDIALGRPRAHLERAAREGSFEEGGFVITAIRGDNGALEGFAMVARAIRTAEPPRPSSDREASADA